MDKTLIAIGSIAEHNADIDTLEALIDRRSFSDVVELLAEIASAKADHLRSNWQDETSAKQYDLVAAKLITIHPWIARVL